MKKTHSEERIFDSDWQPPEVIYGDGIISRITDTDERYAVVTMEIPWNLVRDSVASPPEKVVFVRDMNVETVKKAAEDIPDVDMVMGVGGGSSHDTAKYVAIKKQARLVQVPTMLGGDACITPPVGVRDKGRVTYIGNAVLDKLVIDFSLIRKAPGELVRYGAGDILSSHTAIFDWKLAVDRGMEKFDSKFYDRAVANINELYNRRYDIRDVTDDGIKTIVELFIDYAVMAARLGTDRAQEGSEHFFAYNAEYVTKRLFVHGKLLAVGLFVMSYVQNNNFRWLVDFMKDMGWECSLSGAELSLEEFRKTLVTMKNFVKEGGYYYSVADETDFTPELTATLYSMLK